MTKIKKTIVILGFALLSVGISTKGYANQTVAVTNGDAEAIVATLNCTDGGHMVAVGVGSTVQENLATIVSITINGQTLSVGENGNITLPDYSTVTVTWTSNPTTGEISISIMGAPG